MRTPTHDIPPFSMSLSNGESSLVVDSHVSSNGSTHFNAELQSSQRSSAREIYDDIPAPTTPTERQAHKLASPEIGIAARYKTLGPFGPVIRALGFSYLEHGTAADTQKHTTSFHAAFMQDVNERSALLFGENNQQLVLASDIGFYTPRQYFTPLAEGERIIPSDSLPWLTHDRVLHEPAERALGPTFVTLRQKVVQELLSKNVDSNTLETLMLEDDQLTEGVTEAILKRDGNTIPTAKGEIRVADLLTRYLSRAAPYSLTAYRQFNGERHAPIVDEITKELHFRLAGAAAKLVSVRA